MNFILFAIASGLTVLALVKPYHFAALSIWIIVFGDPVQRLTHIEALTLVDELLIAISFVAFSIHAIKTRGTIRLPQGMKWLLAFLVAGMVSGLVAGAPSKTLALGTIYAAKGAAYYFAVAQLSWTRSEVALLTKAFLTSGLIIAVSGIANLLIPEAWAKIFAPTGNYDVRFGNLSLIGVFSHPTTFAFMMALFSVATFAHVRIFGTRRSLGWLSMLTILESVLSMRRRLWLALVVGLTSVYARTKGTGTIVIASLTLGPLALLIAWPFLTEILIGLSNEYFSDAGQSQAARTVMTASSLEIANTGLGLGAGFGQFGSWIAALHYSPIYRELNFERIYGLAPLEWKGANFLTDTFWPAVIGESGWLGLLFFAFALASIFLFFFRNSSTKTTEPYVRWLATVGVGWSFIYLIDSLAAPTFTAPHSLLFFGLAGVVFSITDKTSNPASSNIPV